MFPRMAVLTLFIVAATVATDLDELFMARGACQPENSAVVDCWLGELEDVTLTLTLTIMASKAGSCTTVNTVICENIYAECVTCGPCLEVMEDGADCYFQDTRNCPVSCPEPAGPCVIPFLLPLGCK